MKTIELSPSELAAFDSQLSRDEATNSDHDEDIVFSRYAVGRRDKSERNSVSISTQTEPLSDIVDGISITPPIATSTPKQPEQLVPRYTTNVGDSLSGQRQLELHNGHGRNTQQILRDKG